jgi:hypothetical protein
MKRCRLRLHPAITGVLVCALALAASSAHAVEIRFRNFSASAAIGPPAD